MADEKKRGRSLNIESDGNGYVYVSTQTTNVEIEGVAKETIKSDLRIPVLNPDQKDKDAAVANAFAICGSVEDFVSALNYGLIYVGRQNADTSLTPAARALMTLEKAINTMAKVPGFEEDSPRELAMFVLAKNESIRTELEEAGVELSL